MKLRSNQSGFSPIELILVIAVVGLIGVVGWLVVDRNNAHKLNATPATADSVDLPMTTSNPEEIKYLSIKEWGLKIALTDSINDAYYIYPDINEGAVFLSTDSLRATGCGNGNEAGVAFYQRFSEGEFNSETKRLYAEQYPDAVKAGSYYYGFGFNPASEKCGADSAKQGKVEAIRAEFKKALKIAK